MRHAAIFALLATALATGCARIQPAWSDLPASDLAGRSSFRIDTATAPADVGGDARKAWEDRRTLVRGLIRHELEARGYREVINDPEFVIRFWGREGADYAQQHHYDEKRGTLDIRAMDPDTGQWLWHGWASETITRRFDAEAALREAVPMILEKFPRYGAGLH